MKLYATVTSERASKGQGGNEYVDIELKAFDREHPIGVISLHVCDDGDERPKQYLITWKDKYMDDAMILFEGHEDEGTIQTAECPPNKHKGKQQKGEVCSYKHPHRGECLIHN